MKNNTEVEDRHCTMHYLASWYDGQLEIKYTGNTPALQWAEKLGNVHKIPQSH